MLTLCRPGDHRRDRRPVLRSIVSLLSPLVPIWDLFTSDNYEVIFSYPVYLRSIANTIQIAIAGGIIGTALIALVVLVSTRSPFRFSRQLEYLAMAPRAVPGVVAGIGIFYAAALFAPLGWLRNTIWILVVAYVMRYIPAGFGAIAPALAQISQDLDRSARTVGADWWRTSTLDPAAADPAGAVLLLRAALHPLLQGIRDRGVPVRAGQRGDRHDHAAVLAERRQRPRLRAGDDPGRADLPVRLHRAPDRWE